MKAEKPAKTNETDQADLQKFDDFNGDLDSKALVKALDAIKRRLK